VTQRRAVLVVPEIPTPPRCGNAWRDLQQLDVLRRMGFTVHVVAARPRWDLTAGEEAAAVRALPGGLTYLTADRAEPAETRVATLRRKATYLAIPTVHPFGWWLPRTLTPAVADLAGAVTDVLLMRSTFVHEIPALRRVWPGRIVVDCHDADVQLARELIKTVRGLARLGPWANLVGVRRTIARFLPLADETWAVSGEDARHLAREAPGARIVVVPSGMDGAGAASAARPGVDGQALLVANFGYGPNTHGADWLLRSVWPEIRRCVPSARLACVGARMPGALRRLAAASPGIQACGQVADLAPLLHGAAVVLAPVRAGSGTRLKIVEAWSQGKAVVTTSKGIEGLPATEGAVAIADAPREFAVTTAALLVDGARRHAMGTRALAVFGEHLTWEVAGRTAMARSVIAAGGAPRPRTPVTT
jgi:glycosyltransferase involved in cell wall biosynthesis